MGHHTHDTAGQGSAACKISNKASELSAKWTILILSPASTDG